MWVESREAGAVIRCCQNTWKRGVKLGVLEMDCGAWFTAEGEAQKNERERETKEGGVCGWGWGGLGVEWRWELRHHFSQQTKTFAGISIWSCKAVFPSCPAIHHLFVLTTTWALHPTYTPPPTHTHAHLNSLTLHLPTEHISAHFLQIQAVAQTMHVGAWGAFMRNTHKSVTHRCCMKRKCKLE